jgi:hypothetical protein
VRRFLRGWSKNLSSQSKQKSKLLAEIDVLDRKAEVSLLSPQEVDLRLHLKGQLTKLLRERRFIGSNDREQQSYCKGMIALDTSI